MKFSQTTLAVSALVVAANAHMRLSNPVPFGLKEDKLDQNPLMADGSDFPCKVAQGGQYLSGDVNAWKAGESKQVAFLGSAVHGGGSCQFSVTKDEKPDKNSDWRVIHSVVGGCPSDAEGNLSPVSKDSTASSKFNVKMPEGMPDGKYTFAWTWFNKIGNREMYMNCAPLQVSGGGGNSSLLQSLPTMMVANAPVSQCTTTESTDPQFDNPGQSVETGSKAKPGKFTGSGCKSSGGTGGGYSGGGQASGSQKPSAPAASSPVASYPGSPATSAAAAPTNPGGVFAPGASGGASGTGAAATTFATQPAAAPTSVAAQPPAASAPSTGNGTSGSGSVSCSNEGAVVCIGSDKFGLCDHGSAVPMALATGMTCSNGKIQKRASHPHIHRRHGSKFL